MLVVNTADKTMTTEGEQTEQPQPEQQEGGATPELLRLIVQDTPLDDETALLSACGVSAEVGVNVISQTAEDAAKRRAEAVDEVQLDTASDLAQQVAAARANPRWVRSSECNRSCMLCTAAFSLRAPKHHCRSCGWAVCGSCSAGTLVLGRWLAPDKPHAVCEHLSKEALRVCNLCHTHLVASAAPLPNAARQPAVAARQPAVAGKRKAELEHEKRGGATAPAAARVEFADGTAQDWEVPDFI
eukprot:COSAG06_NODE_12913_length_1313_cov_0.903624_1_plen_242_part_10